MTGDHPQEGPEAQDLFVQPIHHEASHLREPGEGRYNLSVIQVRMGGGDRPRQTLPYWPIFISSSPAQILPSRERAPPRAEASGAASAASCVRAAARLFKATRAQDALGRAARRYTRSRLQCDVVASPPPGRESLKLCADQSRCSARRGPRGLAGRRSFPTASSVISASVSIRPVQRASGAPPTKGRVSTGCSNEIATGRDDGRGRRGRRGR
jgi:hypothetical protein